MAFLTSSGAAVLRPEQIGPLIVQPVQALSTALQVTTLLSTTSHEMRIPIVTGDVTASWTPEGSDITPADPSVDELVVTPRKLASLTLISNEQANDTSPAAVSLVGESIARNISRELDAAFFGSTTANGPYGIQSIGGVNEVLSDLDNVDGFADAEYDVLAVGGRITAWCASASTARDLSKLKRFTGTSLESNEPLLQPDATQAGRRTINGVPLFIVPGTAVPDGEVWGFDSTRVFSVMREDVSLAVDPSWAFGKDSVAVRATIRVAFGFPHPAAIAHIAPAGSS
ncbi:phage major capsid protein [Mycolicibacter algericus]|uniref:phage major capsid protein n=1 Tax=Mycolicibacter algericus TaxID=1288388 RepID=UPI003C713264